MDTADFRDYCLSFPDVTEKMPFQKFAAARNILAFYIAGHMFCYYDIEKFDECTVKCQPDMISELEARFSGITHPYNGNLRYWIGIHFHADVPDAKIKELVAQSYDIVKSSHIKKK